MRVIPCYQTPELFLRPKLEIRHYLNDLYRLTFFFFFFEKPFTSYLNRFNNLIIISKRGISVISKLTTKTNQPTKPARQCQRGWRQRDFISEKEKRKDFPVAFTETTKRTHITPLNHRLDGDHRTPLVFVGA